MKNELIKKQIKTTKKPSTIAKIPSKYKDIFVRAGLSDREAVVYEALLAHGKLRAQELQKVTPYTRTNLYNILDLLVAKQLVEEETEAKVIRFKPADPHRLSSFVYDQKMRYNEADSLLNSVLPSISELYKMTTERPIVRFYSGKEGIKRVMDDSLTSKTPILTYLDPKAVDKYLSQDNRSYVAQRTKLKITKKILVDDNQFNREHYKNSHNDITDIKFIVGQLPSHFTVMQVYDDKISYMTIKPDSAIGVIIEDKNISSMHRALFEINFQNGKI